MFHPIHRLGLSVVICLALAPPVLMAAPVSGVQATCEGLLRGEKPSASACAAAGQATNVDRPGVLPVEGPRKPRAPNKYRRAPLLEREAGGRLAEVEAFGITLAWIGPRRGSSGVDQPARLERALFITSEPGVTEAIGASAVRYRDAASEAIAIAGASLDGDYDAADDWFDPRLLPSTGVQAASLTREFDMARLVTPYRFDLADHQLDTTAYAAAYSSVVLAVPEPGSVWLAWTGLLALLCLRRHS